MSLDGVLNEILVADTNDGPTEVKKTAWAVAKLMVSSCPTSTKMDVDT